MRLTGKCWMWIGVACPVALKRLLPGIGYVAKQRNRRGRQLGRVLATRSEESDPLAVRLSYVAFYDQRGGGIETSFKGDKQGLGMNKRNKKHFAA